MRRAAIQSIFGFHLERRKSLRFTSPQPTCGHTRIHLYTHARIIHNIPVFLKRRFLGDSAHVQGINGQMHLRASRRASIDSAWKLHIAESLTRRRFVFPPPFSIPDRSYDRSILRADWGLSREFARQTERASDGRDGRSINKKIMQ